MSFAQQYINATELSRFSRVHVWEKTAHTLAEMKFLATVITVGFVVLPQIEDLWSNKWPFAITTFSTIMKRDRFSLILRFLHFTDTRLESNACLVSNCYYIKRLELNACLLPSASSFYQSTTLHVAFEATINLAEL